MFDAAKALCDILISHQFTDENSADHGALLCPAHEKSHTRTGEAVFPLLHLYSETNEKEYLDAALGLLRWLSRVQKDDGSWESESCEVEGLATVSLTLALSHSYQLPKSPVADKDRETLVKMIRKGAEYVCDRATSKRLEQLGPGMGFLALSSSALQFAHGVTGEERYRLSARDNALSAIQQINEEGFLVGERPGVPSCHPYVDVGFSVEISLGALTVYSCLSGNQEVREAVLKALQTHLNFIVPTGYIDDSWGTRMDRWTLLGSEEGIGCQVPFLALRNFDARFQRAAGQNLRFMLKNMMKDGLVTAGPHAKDSPGYRPCITPTALRANALSQTLTYSCGVPLGREGKWILPTEEKGWVRFYKSVNVLQVRTSALLCTITGYGAGAPRLTAPSGGAVSHLWHTRFGTVQAASAYIPALHDFDEHRPRGWLAPRIEALIGDRYFSNLFEPSAVISFSDKKIADDKFEVVVTGALKSQDGDDSGLTYAITYCFEGATIAKRITVRGLPGASLRIIEPVILEEGCDVLPIQTGIEIRHPHGVSCIVTASGQTTQIRRASLKDAVWSYLPVLRALPIVIEPSERGTPTEVSYALELRDWE